MSYSFFMKEAIALAQLGRPKTAPNPCVGAILVQNDQIVGRGYHKAWGENHAEIEAIQNAYAQGATLSESKLFVTLEPCNHFGKTPPCTQSILAAKIPEVIVGTSDFNSMVEGHGLQMLASNGVKTVVGVEEEACQHLIEDFRVWIEKKRPFIELKLAITLDGKIATQTGDSKWVTGTLARNKVHQMRKKAHAVLIGGGTFRQDDPLLTHRLKTDSIEDPQPLAVVVSSKPIDPNRSYALLKKRPLETLFLQREGTTPDPVLLGKKIETWQIPVKNNHLDFEIGLSRLFHEKKCYYILCEGGGQVVSTLLSQRLVDRLHLFIAPKILGDPLAISMASGQSILSLHESMQWKIWISEQIGEDLYVELSSPQIKSS